MQSFLTFGCAARSMTPLAALLGSRRLLCGEGEASLRGSPPPSSSPTSSSSGRGAASPACVCTARHAHAGRTRAPIHRQRTRTHEPPGASPSRPRSRARATSLSLTRDHTQAQRDPVTTPRHDTRQSLFKRRLTCRAGHGHGVVATGRRSQRRAGPAGRRARSRARALAPLRQLLSLDLAWRVGRNGAYEIYVRLPSLRDSEASEHKQHMTQRYSITDMMRQRLTSLTGRVDFDRKRRCASRCASRAARASNSPCGHTRCYQAGMLS
jgi:hypothetical protein